MHDRLPVDKGWGAAIRKAMAAAMAAFLESDLAVLVRLDGRLDVGYF